MNGSLRPVMAAMESKAQKCNFSETEIKVLVSEEEERKGILFGGHSSGITNKKKCVEWHCRSESSWFGQQDSSQDKEVVQCQKSIASHRQSVSETGQGIPNLSPPETRMASIIGDTSMCDIVSERGGVRGTRLTTLLHVSGAFLQHVCAPTAWHGWKWRSAD